MSQFVFLFALSLLVWGGGVLFWDFMGWGGGVGGYRGWEGWSFSCQTEFIDSITDWLMLLICVCVCVIIWTSSSYTHQMSPVALTNTAIFLKAIRLLYRLSLRDTSSGQSRQIMEKAILELVFTCHHRQWCRAVPRFILLFKEMNGQLFSCALFIVWTG